LWPSFPELLITFQVSTSDGDGDDLTVTWVSDWKTLGTGTTLDYGKQKPGTRVVKVSVTDGTETTEEELTLVIKKGEESPGLGMLLTCLSLLAAGHGFEWGQSVDGVCGGGG